MKSTELYKELSLELLGLLENKEFEKIDELFEKRQVILEEQKSNEEFRNILISEGILEIDKEIQKLINDEILQTKNQIKEYKISKTANNSYINTSIDKLNMFNAKV